jgi:hypothetical protein
MEGFVAASYPIPNEGKKLMYLQLVIGKCQFVNPVQSTGTDIFQEQEDV